MWPMGSCSKEGPHIFPMGDFNDREIMKIMKKKKPLTPFKFSVLMNLQGNFVPLKGHSIFPGEIIVKMH